MLMLIRVLMLGDHEQIDFVFNYIGVVSHVIVEFSTQRNIAMSVCCTLKDTMQLCMQFKLSLPA